MDLLSYNREFSDAEAKRLKKQLDDAFPLEVRVDAIYDLLEGRPAVANQILAYRQLLAEQAGFNHASRIVIAASLDVTHPNGQPCAGDDCTWPNCQNNKENR